MMRICDSKGSGPGLKGDLSQKRKHSGEIWNKFKPQTRQHMLVCWFLDKYVTPPAFSVPLLGSLLGNSNKKIFKLSLTAGSGMTSSLFMCLLLRKVEDFSFV